MKWYLKVLSQYSDFSGRASREEYWMFVLFNFLMLAVTSIFMVVFIEGNLEGLGYVIAVLLGLYVLFMLIPSLAVTVRRLHDTGRSGWWYFISLIPYVGGIILFIFMVTKSEQSSNEYGDIPGDLDVKKNKQANKQVEKIKIEKPSNLITETKTAMDGFNQCNQGHFYKESLNECPYCPKGDVSRSDKTEVIGTTRQTNGNDDVEAQKTQVFGGGTATQSKPASNDALRTVISGGETVIGGEEVSTNSKRRLRGWLVSFDVEDFGVDFRIKEGKNAIGQNSRNDITINDNMVSDVHALLLCRNDKFVIRDEMSSNGTYINGEEISPSQPVDLHDGDELKFGKTSYLFRQAFK